MEIMERDPSRPRPQLTPRPRLMCGRYKHKPDLVVLISESGNFEGGLLSRIMKFMYSLGVILIIAVLCSAADYDPSPNPEAVVEVGKARFTVLTEHLVRMEWGGANDAATLAFVNRNLPTPKFTTSKDGNWTIIQTSAVEVSTCMQDRYVTLQLLPPTTHTHTQDYPW